MQASMSEVVLPLDGRDDEVHHSTEMDQIGSSCRDGSQLSSQIDDDTLEDNDTLEDADLIGHTLVQYFGEDISSVTQNEHQPSPSRATRDDVPSEQEPSKTTEPTRFSVDPVDTNLVSIDRYGPTIDSNWDETETDFNYYLSHYAQEVVITTETDSPQAPDSLDVIVPEKLGVPGFPFEEALNPLASTTNPIPLQEESEFFDDMDLNPAALKDCKSFYEAQTNGMSSEGSPENVSPGCGSMHIVPMSDAILEDGTQSPPDELVGSVGLGVVGKNVIVEMNPVASPDVARVPCANLVCQPMSPPPSYRQTIAAAHQKAGHDPLSCCGLYGNVVKNKIVLSYSGEGVMSENDSRDSDFGPPKLDAFDNSHTSTNDHPNDNPPMLEIADPTFSNGKVAAHVIPSAAGEALKSVKKLSLGVVPENGHELNDGSSQDELNEYLGKLVPSITPEFSKEIPSGYIVNDMYNVRNITPESSTIATCVDDVGSLPDLLPVTEEPKSYRTFCRANVRKKNQSHRTSVEKVVSHLPEPLSQFDGCYNLLVSSTKDKNNSTNEQPSNVAKGPSTSAPSVEKITPITRVVTIPQQALSTLIHDDGKGRANFRVTPTTATTINLGVKKLTIVKRQNMKDRIVLLKPASIKKLLGSDMESVTNVKHLSCVQNRNLEKILLSQASLNPKPVAKSSDAKNVSMPKAPSNSVISSQALPDPKSVVKTSVPENLPVTPKAPSTPVILKLPRDDSHSPNVNKGMSKVVVGKHAVPVKVSVPLEYVPRELLPVKCVVPEAPKEVAINKDVEPIEKAVTADGDVDPNAIMDAMKVSVPYLFPVTKPEVNKKIVKPDVGKVEPPTNLVQTKKKSAGPPVVVKMTSKANRKSFSPIRDADDSIENELVKPGQDKSQPKKPPLPKKVDTSSAKAELKVGVQNVRLSNRTCANVNTTSKPSITEKNTVMAKGKAVVDTEQTTLKKVCPIPNESKKVFTEPTLMKNIDNASDDLSSFLSSLSDNNFSGSDCAEDIPPVTASNTARVEDPIIIPPRVFTNDPLFLKKDLPVCKYRDLRKDEFNKNSSVSLSSLSAPSTSRSTVLPKSKPPVLLQREPLIPKPAIGPQTTSIATLDQPASVENSQVENTENSRVVAGENLQVIVELVNQLIESNSKSPQVFSETDQTCTDLSIFVKKGDAKAALENNETKSFASLKTDANRDREDGILAGVVHERTSKLIQKARDLVPDVGCSDGNTLAVKKSVSETKVEPEKTHFNKLNDKDSISSVEPSFDGKHENSNAVEGVEGKSNLLQTAKSTAELFGQSKETLLGDQKSVRAPTKKIDSVLPKNNPAANVLCGKDLLCESELLLLKKGVTPSEVPSDDLNSPSVPLSQDGPKKQENRSSDDLKNSSKSDNPLPTVAKKSEKQKEAIPDVTVCVPVTKATTEGAHQRSEGKECKNSKKIPELPKEESVDSAESPKHKTEPIIENQPSTTSEMSKKIDESNVNVAKEIKRSSQAQVAKRVPGVETSQVLKVDKIGQTLKSIASSNKCAPSLDKLDRQQTKTTEKLTTTLSTKKNVASADKLEDKLHDVLTEKPVVNQSQTGTVSASKSSDGSETKKAEGNDDSIDTSRKVPSNKVTSNQRPAVLLIGNLSISHANSSVSNEKELKNKQESATKDLIKSNISSKTSVSSSDKPPTQLIVSIPTEAISNPPHSNLVVGATLEELKSDKGKRMKSSPQTTDLSKPVLMSKADFLKQTKLSESASAVPSSKLSEELTGEQKPIKESPTSTAGKISAVRDTPKQPTPALDRRISSRRKSRSDLVVSTGEGEEMRNDKDLLEKVGPVITPNPCLDKATDQETAESGKTTEKEKPSLDNPAKLQKMSHRMQTRGSAPDPISVVKEDVDTIKETGKITGAVHSAEHCSLITDTQHKRTTKIPNRPRTRSETFTDKKVLSDGSTENVDAPEVIDEHDVTNEKGPCEKHREENKGACQPSTPSSPGRTDQEQDVSDTLTPNVRTRGKMERKPATVKPIPATPKKMCSKFPAKTPTDPTSVIDNNYYEDNDFSIPSRKNLESDESDNVAQIVSDALDASDKKIRLRTPVSTRRTSTLKNNIARTESHSQVGKPGPMIRKSNLHRAALCRIPKKLVPKRNLRVSMKPKKEGKLIKKDLKNLVSDVYEFTDDEDQSENVQTMVHYRMVSGKAPKNKKNSFSRFDDSQESLLLTDDENKSNNLARISRNESKFASKTKRRASPRKSQSEPRKSESKKGTESQLESVTSESTGSLSSSSETVLPAELQENLRNSRNESIRLAKQNGLRKSPSKKIAPPNKEETRTPKPKITRETRRSSGSRSSVENVVVADDKKELENGICFGNKPSVAKEDGTIRTESTIRETRRSSGSSSAGISDKKETVTAVSSDKTGKKSPFKKDSISAQDKLSVDKISEDSKAPKSHNSVTTNVINENAPRPIEDSVSQISTRSKSRDSINEDDSSSSRSLRNKSLQPAVASEPSESVVEVHSSRHKIDKTGHQLCRSDRSNLDSLNQENDNVASLSTKDACETLIDLSSRNRMSTRSSGVQSFKTPESEMTENAGPKTEDSPFTKLRSSASKRLDVIKTDHEAFELQSAPKSTGPSNELDKPKKIKKSDSLVFAGNKEGRFPIDHIDDVPNPHVIAAGDPTRKEKPKRVKKGGMADDVNNMLMSHSPLIPSQDIASRNAEAVALKTPPMDSTTTQEPDNIQPVGATSQHGEPEGAKSSTRVAQLRSLVAPLEGGCSANNSIGFLRKKNKKVLENNNLALPPNNKPIDGTVITRKTNDAIIKSGNKRSTVNCLAPIVKFERPMVHIDNKVVLESDFSCSKSPSCELKIEETCDVCPNRDIKLTRRITRSSSSTTPILDSKHPKSVSKGGEGHNVDKNSVKSSSSDVLHTDTEPCTSEDNTLSNEGLNLPSKSTPTDSLLTSDLESSADSGKHSCPIPVDEATLNSISGPGKVGALTNKLDATKPFRSRRGRKPKAILTGAQFLQNKIIFAQPQTVNREKEKIALTDLVTPDPPSGEYLPSLGRNVAPGKSKSSKKNALSKPSSYCMIPSNGRVMTTTKDVCEISGEAEKLLEEASLDVIVPSPGKSPDSTTQNSSEIIIPVISSKLEILAEAKLSEDAHGVTSTTELGDVLSNSERKMPISPHGFNENNSPTKKEDEKVSSTTDSSKILETNEMDSSSEHLTSLKGDSVLPKSVTVTAERSPLNKVKIMGKTPVFSAEPVTPEHPKKSWRVNPILNALPASNELTPLVVVGAVENEVPNLVKSISEEELKRTPLKKRQVRVYSESCDSNENAKKLVCPPGGSSVIHSTNNVAPSSTSPKPAAVVVGMNSAKDENISAPKNSSETGNVDDSCSRTVDRLTHSMYRILAVSPDKLLNGPSEETPSADTKSSEPSVEKPSKDAKRSEPALNKPSKEKMAHISTRNRSKAGNKVGKRVNKKWRSVLSLRSSRSRGVRKPHLASTSRFKMNRKCHKIVQKPKAIGEEKQPSPIQSKLSEENKDTDNVPRNQSCVGQLSEVNVPAKTRTIPISEDISTLDVSKRVDSNAKSGRDENPVVNSDDDSSVILPSQEMPIEVLDLAKYPVKVPSPSMNKYGEVACVDTAHKENEEEDSPPYSPIVPSPPTVDTTKPSDCNSHSGDPRGERISPTPTPSSFTRGFYDTPPEVPSEPLMYQKRLKGERIRSFSNDEPDRNLILGSKSRSRRKSHPVENMPEDLSNRVNSVFGMRIPPNRPQLDLTGKTAIYREALEPPPVSYDIIPATLVRLIPTPPPNYVPNHPQVVQSILGNVPIRPIPTHLSPIASPVSTYAPITSQFNRAEEMSNELSSRMNANYSLSAFHSTKTKTTNPNYAGHNPLLYAHGSNFIQNSALSYALPSLPSTSNFMNAPPLIMKPNKSRSPRGRTDGITSNTNATASKSESVKSALPDSTERATVQYHEAHRLIANPEFSGRHSAVSGNNRLSTTGSIVDGLGLKHASMKKSKTYIFNSLPSSGSSGTLPTTTSCQENREVEEVIEPLDVVTCELNEGNSSSLSNISQKLGSSVTLERIAPKQQTPTELLTPKDMWNEAKNIKASAKGCGELNVTSVTEAVLERNTPTESLYEKPIATAAPTPRRRISILDAHKSYKKNSSTVAAVRPTEKISAHDKNTNSSPLTIPSAPAAPESNVTITIQKNDILRTISKRSEKSDNSVNTVDRKERLSPSQEISPPSKAAIKSFGTASNDAIPKLVLNKQSEPVTSVKPISETPAKVDGSSMSTSNSKCQNTIPSEAGKISKSLTPRLVHSTIQKVTETGVNPDFTCNKPTVTDSGISKLNSRKTAFGGQEKITSTVMQQSTSDELVTATTNVASSETQKSSPAQSNSKNNKLTELGSEPITTGKLNKAVEKLRAAAIETPISEAKTDISLTKTKSNTYEFSKSRLISTTKSEVNVQPGSISAQKTETPVTVVHISQTIDTAEPIPKSTVEKELKKDNEEPAVVIGESSSQPQTVTPPIGAISKLKTITQPKKSEIDAQANISNEPSNPKSHLKVHSVDMKRNKTMSNPETCSTVVKKLEKEIDHLKTEATTCEKIDDQLGTSNVDFAAVGLKLNDPKTADHTTTGDKPITESSHELADAPKTVKVSLATMSTEAKDGGSSDDSTEAKNEKLPLSNQLESKLRPSLDNNLRKPTSVVPCTNQMALAAPASSSSSVDKSEPKQGKISVDIEKPKLLEGKKTATALPLPQDNCSESRTGNAPTEAQNIIKTNANSSKGETQLGTAAGSNMSSLDGRLGTTNIDLGAIKVKLNEPQTVDHPTTGAAVDRVTSGSSDKQITERSHADAPKTTEKVSLPTVSTEAKVGESSDDFTEVKNEKLPRSNQVESKLLPSLDKNLEKATSVVPSSNQVPPNPTDKVSPTTISTEAKIGGSSDDSTKAKNEKLPRSNQVESKLLPSLDNNLAKAKSVVASSKQVPPKTTEKVSPTTVSTEAKIGGASDVSTEVKNAKLPKSNHVESKLRPSLDDNLGKATNVVPCATQVALAAPASSSTHIDEIEAKEAENSVDSALLDEMKTATNLPLPQNTSTPTDDASTEVKNVTIANSPKGKAKLEPAVSSKISVLKDRSNSDKPIIPSVCPGETKNTVDPLGKKIVEDNPISCPAANEKSKEKAKAQNIVAPASGEVVEDKICNSVTVQKKGKGKSNESVQVKPSEHAVEADKPNNCQVFIEKDNSETAPKKCARAVLSDEVSKSGCHSDTERRSPDSEVKDCPLRTPLSSGSRDVSNDESTSNVRELVPQDDSETAEMEKKSNSKSVVSSGSIAVDSSSGVQPDEKRNPTPSDAAKDSRVKGNISEFEHRSVVLMTRSERKRKRPAWLDDDSVASKLHKHDASPSQPTYEVDHPEYGKIKIDRSVPKVEVELLCKSVIRKLQENLGISINQVDMAKFTKYWAEFHNDHYKDSIVGRARDARSNQPTESIVKSPIESLPDINVRPSTSRASEYSDTIHSPALRTWVEEEEDQSMPADRSRAMPFHIRALQNRGEKRTVSQAFAQNFFFSKDKDPRVLSSRKERARGVPIRQPLPFEIPAEARKPQGVQMSYSWILEHLRERRKRNQFQECNIPIPPCKEFIRPREEYMRRSLKETYKNIAGGHPTSLVSYSRVSAVHEVPASTSSSTTSRIPIVPISPDSEDSNPGNSEDATSEQEEVWWRIRRKPNTSSISSCVSPQPVHVSNRTSYPSCRKERYHKPGAFSPSRSSLHTEISPVGRQESARVRGEHAATVGGGDDPITVPDSEAAVHMIKNLIATTWRRDALNDDPPVSRDSFTSYQEDASSPHVTVSPCHPPLSSSSAHPPPNTERVAGATFQRCLQQKPFSARGSSENNNDNIQVDSLEETGRWNERSVDGDLSVRPHGSAPSSSGTSDFWVTPKRKPEATQQVLVKFLDVLENVTPEVSDEIAVLYRQTPADGPPNKKKKKS